MKFLRSSVVAVPIAMYLAVFLSLGPAPPAVGHPSSPSDPMLVVPPVPLPTAVAPPMPTFRKRQPIKKDDHSEDCDLLHLPENELLRLFPPRDTSMSLRPWQDATPCWRAVDRLRWYRYDKWWYDYRDDVKAYKKRWLPEVRAALKRLEDL